MAIANFNVTIDHHRFSNKTHSAHTNIIAKLFKFIFKFGNFWIRVTVANNPQTGGTFSKHHAGIFGSSKADADNRRLAGKTAFAKRHK